jgi:hypothetical protein
MHGKKQGIQHDGAKHVNPMKEINEPFLARGMVFVGVRIQERPLRT